LEQLVNEAVSQGKQVATEYVPPSSSKLWTPQALSLIPKTATPFLLSQRLHRHTATGRHTNSRLLLRRAEYFKIGSTEFHSIRSDVLQQITSLIGDMWW
jgi:hypothetical protein